MNRERQTVAYVSRRHGAYLVQFSGDLVQDATTDELVDAASNLSTAKRLAREGAAGFGYVGSPRWEQRNRYLWVLQLDVDFDDLDADRQRQTNEILGIEEDE